MLAGLGAIAGAAGNIIGGMMTSRAQREANDANALNAARNIKLQEEFAQKGIRWKVADAKKAGIHPLYALGASTHSFSPVSVGAQAETGIGSGLAAAGQDISRAIHATRTGEERISAEAQTMRDLAVKNLALRNDLLAAQITKTRAPQVGPPMPSADRSLQIFENSPAFVTPGKEAQAQKVEDEYGEFAGDVSGGIRVLRDALRAHGVPIGATPSEYSKIFGNWLLSDANKVSVSVMPGSYVDRFLRSLPVHGR